MHNEKELFLIKNATTDNYVYAEQIATNGINFCSSKEFATKYTRVFAELILKEYDDYNLEIIPVPVKEAVIRKLIP